MTSLEVEGGQTVRDMAAGEWLRRDSQQYGNGRADYSVELCWPSVCVYVCEGKNSVRGERDGGIPDA